MKQLFFLLMLALSFSFSSAHSQTVETDSSFNDRTENSFQDEKDNIHQIFRDQVSRINKNDRHLHLPLRQGLVCYEYISPMDSSLGKEVIYKNALNWYMRSFPYAYKNLIVNDQYHGKIIGRCNFQFTYSWLMDEYVMKVDFAVDITVKYGKCRLRFSQIEPKDEIKGEESASGRRSYSTWEDRSLELMNIQYLQTSSPAGFEKEKLSGIDDYFRAKIAAFSLSQHQLKRFIGGRDSF